MSDASSSQESLLSPEEIADVTAVTSAFMTEIDRLLLGRSELHRLVLTALLSRGHVLLEGLPGVGKTALVKALGDLLGLEFQRVQFTPDLMPSDILGSHILQPREDGTREMVFQQGPIFTNILLADEINRASPKTQSALLEAMQEHHVTLLGTTRALPEPFLVLASQNPVELEGTYPLPEAQLDRFLYKLQVGQASVEVLESIIGTRRRGEPPKSEWRLQDGQIEKLFAAMDRVMLPRAVGRYVARLVSATHPENAEATEAVRSYVTYGASPRAAIAIAEAGRAWALTAGRPTVGFEDVRAVAPHVLNHRLILGYQARFDKATAFDVVDDLLARLEEVRTDLPNDVAVGEAVQA